MLGALAFLTKPVSKETLDATLGDLKRFAKRRVRKLLVVEDNEAQRKSIVELIGEGDVKTDWRSRPAPKPWRPSRPRHSTAWC